MEGVNMIRTQNQKTLKFAFADVFHRVHARVCVCVLRDNP